MTARHEGTADLRYLGRTRVTVDGGSVSLRSRPTAALLAYTACTGTAHARTSLAAMFWPTSGQDRAMANLRVVLSDLRRAVGDVLDITREAVRLAPAARDRVDVLRFRDAADQALARARVIDARPLLRAAMAEYGGELLAGFDLEGSPEFELWLTTERTDLHLRAVHVLEALVDTDLDHGATPDTVATARRLVALEPTREQGQARLMQSQWHLGDRAAALADFETWAKSFEDDLGLPVSDDLQALAARIRDSDPPPRAGHEQPPARLPALTTTLVGRDDDLQQLGDLLAGGTRLVTLTGPAGVGKTTLAIAACHERHGIPADGVTYVDLVDVASGQLWQSIADATSEDRLHGRLQAPATSRDARPPRGLLVLDNFEHLLNDRDVVATLLADSADLQVLATSRTPIGLPNEHLMPLAPLEVPTTARHDRDVGDTDAVRLFLDRTASAGSPITASARNLQAVSHICRTVDGLPLGVEIAASRVRMLGLEGLAGAITGQTSGPRPLDVLARRGAGDERHHSVRDAIAWSVSLLSETARAVLYRLSVFTGTFDLDAVIGVCTATADEELTVVDALAELVDFHLVTRVRQGDTSSRFRLRMTTREFAGEELASTGRAAEVQRRHAEHVATTARADKGSGARAWADRVANLPNVAAAVRWFAAHDRADDAVQLLADVGPAWRYAGVTAQGLAAHRVALDAGSGSDPAVVAACAIARASLIADDRGREGAGAVSSLIEEHLPTLRACGDTDRWARCTAEAVRTLSYVGVDLGALELAAELADTAVSERQRRWELGARWQTAWIAHRRGDDRKVEKILQGLIADAIALGNRRVELYGWMLARMSDVDQSALSDQPPSLRELLDLAVELDDLEYTMWMRCSVGAAAAMHREPDEAASHFRQALALAREADFLPAQGYCVLGVVTMRASIDDLAPACRLQAAVEQHLDELVHVLPRSFRTAYQDVADHLRTAAAGDDDLAAAWSAGTRLSLRAAAAEAGELLETTARPS